MAEDKGLTSEELAAGHQVGAAGTAAAVAAPTAEAARPATEKAIKDEAKKQGMELSDEQRKLLADAIVDAIDQRGGFDQPPEPVHAPAAAPAEAPAAGAGAEAAAAPPRKQSWAERHFRSS